MAESKRMMEARFVIAAAEVGSLIKAEFEAATAAISRATALSDEHGIPFSGEGMEAHVPDSFSEKYGEITPKEAGAILEEVAGFSVDLDAGWNSSQVCW